MKTFRAWIDRLGFNADLEHADCARSCRHARLVDLETDRRRILVRIVRRLWPPHLHLMVFVSPYRGTTILRLGRP